MNTRALEQVRHDIDNLDIRILFLLKRRLELSLEAARAKAESGLPVYDPKREEQLASRVVEGPVRNVYAALVARCRDESIRAVEALVPVAVDGRGPRSPAQRAQGR